MPLPEGRPALPVGAAAPCSSPQPGPSTPILPHTHTILPLPHPDPQVGFACGGSGSLFRTADGGRSWKRNKAADDLAANLYEIKFSQGGNGVVLGNDATLLRFIGQVDQA